jgi:hypothetical protein
MTGYTLDTNALIYAVRDAGIAANFEKILAEQAPLFVSTITVIELFSSAHASEREHATLGAILRGCRVIPVDLHVAQIAAGLRRTYRIKTPDAAIAATALSTYSTLITRNTKDFASIVGLELLSV